MAYEKRTWVSGTTPCSSENFNHMEQGIADAHDKLDELNTKNTWKKLGQVTGLGKNISLSGTEEAQEYKCVLVFRATTTGTNLTITIPIMRGNIGTHISGYKYSDNYYGTVGVLYSLTDNYMQIVSSWTRIYNASSIDQSDIAMTVYYR